MPAAKKSPQRKKKAPEPPKNSGRAPRRREIGAFLCLIMGIFTLAAIANTSGWLLVHLRSLITGFIGWGFFAVPPALFVIAFILGFHRGRPVRLRVVCMAVIPVLLGALLHLFLSGTFDTSGGLFSVLWDGGQEMRAGGVIAGILANVLESMVGRVVTAVLLIIGLCAMALLVCNKTPVDIVDSFKNRERREYELEDDYDDYDEL